MRVPLFFTTAFFCLHAIAIETYLKIPSDANAKFYVLEKNTEGTERTIVTKRIGSSGTIYSKRIYSCKDNTVKYIGSGDSIAEMNASKPDSRMSPIVQGSIAYYVGVEACQ